MQIKRFIVVVSMVVAAGWVTVGCSESNSRRTARELNEATEKATKLSLRAQALLANPQFVANGERSPLRDPMVPAANLKRLQDMIRENRSQSDIAKEMDELAKMVAGKIQFVALDQLHPGALAALQEAYKTLDAAIGAAGDPGNDETVKGALAVARTTLASVHSDMGQLYRREFDNARAEAVVGAALVELAARQVAREQAVIAVLDTLLKPVLGPNAVSYEQALQNAKDLQADAKSAVDKLTAQVKALDQNRAALQSEINQLSRDATESLLASQAEAFDFDKSETLLEESVAFSEQVIAKSREMNEKEAALSEAQTSLAVAQVILAVFTGEGAVAADDEGAATEKAPASAGRVKDADAVVTSYKAMQTRVEAFRKEAQTNLTQYEQQCAAGLAAIGDCYRRAKVAADENAIKQFDMAARTASTSYQLRGDPATKALEGAALREYAGLRQQQRELLASVLQAVALVPNASDEDVIGKVDSAVSVKDWGFEATAKYEASATAFEVAVRALGGERRHQAWVYQANGAASLLQLALMTDDAAKRADSIRNASTLVAEALTNRESSPYLQHVRQLNAQVQLARGAAPWPTTPTAAE